MNSFFDLDNPAWRFIGKIFDACFLSIIYLIFCIPIFTIGAANTALYYALLKLTKDEEGYVIRDFFKSFKQNFKQSTLVWIILFIVGIVLVIDVYYFKFIPTIKGAFMYYLFCILFLFYSILNLYIFPLIAKFENTTKNMFKFSFIMPIKHFGWTTLMVVLGLVIILSASRVPPILAFVPGILGFFNSYIFNHIFDIYIKKINENNLIEE
ncbi:MAG: YesL family protein [Lachnospirales bacterium]